MAKKIPGEKFYKAIMESQQKGQLTNEALEYFKILVENIGNTLRYENPIDKQDCEQTALLDCLAGWKKFNPNITTNAFSFFTQIVKNGFVKGWNNLHPGRKKGTIRLTGGNPEDCTGIYSL